MRKDKGRGLKPRPFVVYCDCEVAGLPRLAVVFLANPPLAEAGAMNASAMSGRLPDMSIVVVIPAYNEERTVGEVVQNLLGSPHPTLSLRERETEGRVRVIVVDDGSTDGTAQAARAAGANVLQHPINRGLGAALATGIEGAVRMLNVECRMQNGEGVIVTLDADGQHDPTEIARVVQPILDGRADVVIGTRFRNPSLPPSPGLRPPSPLGRGQGEGIRVGKGSYEIPTMRRVANWLGNFFTWFLFGIWVSDSQSGFRAFSGAAAQKLHLRTSTMEVSSEIIREIAQLKLRLVEVPISVRYTKYSLSKGQGFFRGLETLWKLVALKFFR